MFTTWYTYFMRRGYFWTNYVSFVSVMFMEEISDNAFVVLFIVFFEVVWRYRIGEEWFYYFFRCVFLYFAIDVTFDFEPCFFEKTWPEINSFDRLWKKWHFIWTNRVVINVDIFFPRTYIHLQQVNSVWICVGEDYFVYELWVIGQKA